MVADDLTINTFVDEIPQPFSTEREEVKQEYLLPNQYQAQPVVPFEGVAVFYTLTRSDSITPDPTTVTTVGEFVLTHVAIEATGDPQVGSCSEDAILYINGVEFRTIRIVTATTNDHFAVVEAIPIPNWLMPSGTVFGAYIDADPDSSMRINVTFLGYQKK